MICCCSYSLEWTTFRLLGFGLLVPDVEEMPLAEFFEELRFLETTTALFWPEATALLLDLWEVRLCLFVKSLLRL